MIPALEERYAIERELGHGGMATVYLATDLKLQRQVALKVLRPELAASLGNQRFLREIQIATRVSHPNILSLHDSGEAAGTLYYAMPYVEGESLRGKLDREGQLSLAEVITIIKAVGGALTYAHRLGIIHRDIKPENILLAKNPDGGPIRPLVTDFGIARALDAAGGERLTETGLALGTPAYMSPEQAASGARLDARSDIYSLGCVAYEMLAGAPPFTGPTAQSVLARHAVDRVPPLHTVRATVPPSMEAAIERALAKVPADRFGTAEEFAQALGNESPIRQPRTRTSRRVRRLATALVAVVAAIGLAVRFMTTSARAAVVPSASKMAVLPLLSLGGDTALIRLGRDLANTISASLAGVGGIQLVDRLSIATSTAGKELSPADGAALARRFGATSFVEGTLVGAGDQVRLDLGLYGTEKLEPLARGVTVTAHRDSIRLLTDSASLGLLRQVWRRGEPPTPNLAAVTTRSLPALRAFLEGERQLAAGRWDDAQLAYHAATDADSSFGLAWWRYAFAKWWIEEEPDSAILSVARRHSSELPEKDRLLAELWGDTQERGVTQEILDRGRMLTQRFPSYWPAWFEYADLLFHFGPMFGQDIRKAVQAFQRVLELNPRLVPAWHHLLNAASGIRDTAVVSQSLASLDSLEPLDPNAPPREQRRLIRWSLRLMQGEPFEGPSVDSLVRDIATLKSVGEQTYLPVQVAVIMGARAELELSRRVVAESPWPTTVALHRKGIALAWASRGAWDSALVAIDTYASRRSELASLTSEQIVEAQAAPDLARLDPYRFAVVGAWLGALDPQQAISRREPAAQAVARMGAPELQVELFWFDGVLAFSRGDIAALRQAQRELVKSDTDFSSGPRRSLAAFQLELLHHPREAADSMAAVALARPWLRHVPYWGINVLAAARWLAAAGSLDSAALLLPWWQAMLPGADFVHSSEVLWAPSILEAARVEAARGNQDLAREQYREFLRIYDAPNPRLQYLVDDARTALRKLE